jgi:NAD(P)-dependent dehydrogenase (short-subunit alcohol dehydrogenase family)
MDASSSLFDLTGKIALVTGAGSGLGCVFARVLAAHGAEAIVADIDLIYAEETCGLIAQAGGRAVPLEVDVADPTSVERMVAAHSRVEVLINNADIAALPRRVHAYPIDDWHRLIGINLTGVFLCTRAVLPRMLAAGKGSIINIASIIGLIGHYPGFAVVGASYAAAKAGLGGFTRQVAVEYAKDGIRCNAIAPGWHGGTRLCDRVRAELGTEGTARFEAAIVAGTPMGRRGVGVCVADEQLWKASDNSKRDCLTLQLFELTVFSLLPWGPAGARSTNYR